MTRRTKLEKALAGPKNPLRGEGYSSTTRNWMAGESDTYAVLAPLHAALIEAVDMLELLGCEKAKLGNSFTRYKSRKALAKIDDVLDSVQSSPNHKPEREESGT